MDLIAKQIRQPHDVIRFWMSYDLVTMLKDFCDTSGFTENPIVFSKVNFTIFHDWVGSDYRVLVVAYSPRYSANGVADTIKHTFYLGGTSKKSISTGYDEVLTGVAFQDVIWNLLLDRGYIQLELVF